MLADEDIVMSDAETFESSLKSKGKEKAVEANGKYDVENLPWYVCFSACWLIGTNLLTRKINEG